jgi:NDP-sugar pyrophosphorylase family protein
MSPLGVAIVAGGPGLRLAAINPGRPKALAHFDGMTLLDHQLDRVQDLTSEPILVLACHGAEAVRRHLREREGRHGCRAQIIVEPHPLGTAGALHALPDAPERWLVRNVDHVSDVDLSELIEAPIAPCTAVLTEVDLPIDEGVVQVEEGNLVDWQERPVHRVQVTTGLYLFSRSALRSVLDGRPLDMPDLVRALMPDVRAWHHRGTWFDAGTPERLRAAERWWKDRREGRPRVRELGS